MVLIAAHSSKSKTELLMMQLKKDGAEETCKM